LEKLATLDGRFLTLLRVTIDDRIASSRRQSRILNFILFQDDNLITLGLLCLAVIAALLARPVYRIILLLTIGLHAIIAIIGPIAMQLGLMEPPSYLPNRSTYFTELHVAYLAAIALVGAALSRVVPRHRLTPATPHYRPTALVWVAPASIVLIVTVGLLIGNVWPSTITLLLPLAAAQALFMASGRPRWLGTLVLIAGLAITMATGNRHAVGIYIVYLLLTLLIIRSRRPSNLWPRRRRHKTNIAVPLATIAILAIPLFAVGTLLKDGSNAKLNAIKIRLLFSQAEGHAALIDARLNGHDQDPPALSTYYEGILPGVTRQVNMGKLTYLLSRSDAVIRRRDDHIP
jgi:hypothetical protein